jgi:hypothetical protein
MLERAEHLKAGGWWCSGLDPLNKFEPMEWGCFKPDRPRRDTERDRPIKYENPHGVPTRILFLQTDAGDYWPTVLADPETPLIITEGAKKAAAGLSHEFATVAAAGVWNLTEKTDSGEFQLHPDLKDFVAGRTVYLAMDQDKSAKTRWKVAVAIKRAAQCLELAGADVYVVSWKPKLGKGLDDLIVNNDVEAFQDAIAKAAGEILLMKQSEYQEMSRRARDLIDLFAED